MYNHKEIEKRWQREWEKSGLYKTKEDKKKPKYYILDMFPYPSGAGLHVGHPKGYIATDVFARMKMMQGFNVLHPMGWDAFGLPAENYAIENKIHPRVATEKNVKVFKNQLLKLGFTYDWGREINTTDPEYYKWTQWIFLQMFKRGLAYESFEPINWCLSCQTGLANEDLENGKCERCGSEIERKPMRQWVLKITDYADRLLNDLEKLPDWEESIKEMQRNWIGRSEGATVKFNVIARSGATKQSREQSEKNGIATLPSVARDDKITVFTTRPDTLFGCTYMVVAPEHELITNYELSPPQRDPAHHKYDKAAGRITNYAEVKKYIEQARKKSDLERTELQKEKTGVKLEGLMAINPVNNEEIPIFVADYVMMNYGTGAIMAVPAHDHRDWEFAKKYSVKIIPVVRPKEQKILLFSGKTDVVKDKTHPRYNFSISVLTESINKQGAMVIDGININSGFLDGLETSVAKEKIINWLEEKRLGKRAVNYKLKDWVFSRQRYWGEPIPIIHCDKCGSIGVPEKDLPVKLPEVKNYEPTGTGESPLANIKDWVNTKCPKCGGLAKRETNTMPQWAGSSWYWLRYIDPKNKKALVDKKKEKYWSPVDFYVGGAEHATRHLIYARFWHKFLFDIGIVSYPEPFTRLQHVGLILAEDGRKMSKRWGNVINPDEVVEKYGADSMRVYEMFMGPFSQSCAWSTKGLVGARRFLEKIWYLRECVKKEHDDIISIKSINGFEIKKANLIRILHKTIKKVSEDIEGFKYNTAIAQMMIFTNEMEKWTWFLPKNIYSQFIILLAPFVPHLAEELWHELGSKESIFKEKWPEYNKKLIKDETINLVVQVNGKLRDMILVSADISEKEAKEEAMKSEKIRKWIEGKEIVKIIFVKGRLINIVVR